MERPKTDSPAAAFATCISGHLGTWACVATLHTVRNLFTYLTVGIMSYGKLPGKREFRHGAGVSDRGVSRGQWSRQSESGQSRASCFSSSHIDP